MSDSKIADLTVKLHQETDRAILVSDDGDLEKAVWLPKSQVEFEKQRGDVITVACPEWLAKERGLI